MADDASELLEIGFDRDDVTRTRHTLTRLLKAISLDTDRLDALVLAVNEIITNVVRHGGGAGRLRVWRTPGRVWCEVRDFGTGSSAATLNGHSLPPITAAGGRGLWLARELCETFLVDTGAQGTVVRVAILEGHA
jgi:serine/threonine-protein kinase RsbW